MSVGRAYVPKTEPKPCRCGLGCGLSFIPERGRRFHPQCPNRGGERNQNGRLRRDGTLELRGAKFARCRECEDQPWRRPYHGVCPRCAKAWEPDRIERPAASPGCGLATVL